MSEINKEELAEMPLETMGLASRPEDNILRSFNALNPKVTDRLLNNLKTVVQGDISDYVNISTDGRNFIGNFESRSSSFESRYEFSLSVGVKGKYGVFSASAKTKTEKVDSSSFTTLYSTYIGDVNKGNVSLRGLNNAGILELLQPEMVSQLKAISSLADAKEFTNTWGTHLVTRVDMGALILVSNSVQTESNEVKQAIAVDLNAKYRGATLVSAIKISSTIKQERTSITQTRRLLGGDVRLAGRVDPDKPETIDAWFDSISSDTTYVVSESIEIFTLVNGTAREMLKKYIDLALLAFSLENPIVLTGGNSIAPFNPTLAIAKPLVDFAKEFKIIGGGAEVTERSNNFLMSSYPQATDKSSPTAWNAISHDLMSPAAPKDQITSYAIAIHDPEDYIAVMVADGKGKNKEMGEDYAEATLPKDWILTCGGVSSETKKGTNKFVTASYFKDNDNQTWRAESSDYKQAATDVELKAFAVGIKSTDPKLIIKADYQEGPIVRGQHGRTTTTGRTAVCGGGVSVKKASGPGNLVQMFSPVRGNEWQATSKDHDSSISQASTQSFAISLQASVEV